MNLLIDVYLLVPLCVILVLLVSLHALQVDIRVSLLCKRLSSSVTMSTFPFCILTHPSKAPESCTPPSRGVSSLMTLLAFSTCAASSAYFRDISACQHHHDLEAHPHNVAQLLPPFSPPHCSSLKAQQISRSRQSP